MTGACTPAEARKYLKVSKNFLAKLPIPKANVAAPDAERATWRYRYEDLDAFLQSRTVLPGHA